MWQQLQLPEPFPQYSAGDAIMYLLKNNYVSIAYAFRAVSKLLE